MILRMSSLFVRTLRDDPADAEVPSHRLLVRAGYIRRAAPGIYTWLPLGLRVLRNIERIVREEMDAIGAQELQFPALLPREPYEATGRWTEYGDGIFRLKDRKGADYLLGPTHEEMFTLVVKDLYSSYKDLPLSALPDPDEVPRRGASPRRAAARPRVRDEGLLLLRRRPTRASSASYAAHREAYVKTFDRLGFDYVIVKATSGAMGGSTSRGVPRHRRERRGHLRPLHARATTPPTSRPSQVRAPAARRRTTTRPPRTRSRRRTRPTIETLVDHLNEKFPRDDRPWNAGDTLKNVLVVLKHPDGTREPIAIGLPGDREVDEKRLEGQLEPTEVEAFDEADFAKHPSLAKGYIGPGVLGEKNESGIRYLVDPRVVEGTRWVTGADVSGLARARPGGRPRLHARRHDRGRRGPRRRPLPELRRHAADRPRHRDGPHLRARPQVRRRARPPGARRERQAGHGHHGLLRHRRLAGRRRDRGEHPRRARPGLAPRGRPGRRAPRRRPARTTAVFDAAAKLAVDLTARGLTVLYDDRAEGLARREVQGRRADRRADDRRGRARASSTGSSRSRTGRPGSGRTSRWPRPSTTSSGRRELEAVTRNLEGSSREPMTARIEAVIFDWGGTLTPWHDVDFAEEARALAAGGVDADEAAHERLRAGRRRGLGPLARPPHQRDGRRPLPRGRADHDPRCSTATAPSGSRTPAPTRTCAPLFSRLKVDGIKVGVLSNTVWPREWHEDFFRRDGVLELLDGAVYTSEIPWTKPAPQAFRAAMQAVGVDGPGGLRLRGGPALRRHLGRGQRRHAHHPRAAQRHPARARSGTPRASRTRSRTGCARVRRGGGLAQQPG